MPSHPDLKRINPLRRSDFIASRSSPAVHAGDDSLSAASLRLRPSGAPVSAMNRHDYFKAQARFLVKLSSCLSNLAQDESVVRGQSGKRHERPRNSYCRRLWRGRPAYRRQSGAGLPGQSDHCRPKSWAGTGDGSSDGPRHSRKSDRHRRKQKLQGMQGCLVILDQSYCHDIVASCRGGGTARNHRAGAC
jgi:hypothetical protein